MIGIERWTKNDSVSVSIVVNGKCTKTSIVMEIVKTIIKVENVLYFKSTKYLVLHPKYCISEQPLIFWTLFGKKVFFKSSIKSKFNGKRMTMQIRFRFKDSFSMFFRTQQPHQHIWPWKPPSFSGQRFTDRPSGSN